MCKPWSCLCRSFFLILLVTSSTAEEQIKWIPADDNQSGSALPLSTNQREELLRLEEAIMKSPDPAATLQKVAASNQMDPNDLAQMLQSNRASYGSVAGQRPSSIFAVASSKAMSVVKQYPLRTFVTLTLLLAVYYLLVIDLPRTGILLSRQRRNLWTKGPTSMFHPSREYLNQRLESSSFLETSCSEEDPAELWDKLEPRISDDDDGLTLQRRSKDWRRAMTYQTTVSFDEVFGITQKENDDGDKEDLLGHEADVLLSTPSTLVEYAPGLTIVSSKDASQLLAVVSGMGDWGRYGLLELVVSQQDEDLLVLTTTKGSHWEGQIVVAIDILEDALRVRASLIVMAGHVPRWSLVEGMSKSIVQSLRTRCRQDMARRKQSSRFARVSRERAKRRRAERSEKIRQIEAMAEDRRRRWQRNNPNVGHYRPSGDRMKSPNNAVY